uniref:Uncharacterized protein n=1 Tax=Proboscia inermis TaxID=420281 RepID=A0A7S0C7A3_9STRA|mmetsp:Transcript_21225/g.24427  ORF Transcript_21225/g.24427 Transcript_21225/m.24427 type:complete len:164 (-) Transcript_21225:19-510(-)|eukprot:CAMPEP_0194359020 /NCGR_PEP_ID=MMETSP0174-20130528/6275_1 /TAXON_ID=216777 /ORGANISM="Proboscia alata, Strain PI-D3" /LENGTH=163 /DNA_ID=CAMNT_0039129689 /DNA_START=41 /DNA_END=532 /DNA_ORIENTATION=-
MGKKSRKSKTSGPAVLAESNHNETESLNSSIDDNSAIYYPSDGPSDVEMLQTTSQSLQTKLDQLTELGLAGDKKGFVSQFVPLDLSPIDAAGYLKDLTTAPEAEGQWRNLISEISAIRCGKGVDRIEGDQVSKAVFHFIHPLLEKCDREVSFACKEGEWRAEA